MGRFSSVDAWAEKYPSHSPYNYVFNNPIKLIDPTGNGPTGDIYSTNGIHLGSDGVDDNRVYITNSTDQLTEDQASLLVLAHDFVGTWSGNEGGGGLTELGIGHDAFQTLAATVYGESGNSNNSKEMFGIASAIVNNNTARGENASLTNTISDIAYAASDGNARYSKFTEASVGARGNNKGMTTANAAAINALSGGRDYSNGATGWDGNDLPTNSHRFGLNISNPSHDIYGVGNSPLTQRENGSSYRRQSTAAHGGTMFYKIHPTFVSGGGRAY